MRKAPSLRAVPSSGRLPQASLMERTNGRMIPPLLAATLGIAGASRASLRSQKSAQNRRRQQRFNASTGQRLELQAAVHFTAATKKLSELQVATAIHCIHKQRAENCSHKAGWFQSSASLWMPSSKAH